MSKFDELNSYRLYRESHETILVEIGHKFYVFISSAAKLPMVIGWLLLQ